jgi:hypothetical protein
VSDELDGFDSESDRRDAIRKQIVDECLFTVRENICTHGATLTSEERHFLELEVACKLLESLRLDAMSVMMTQETLDALNKLEKP